jgi:hypothetical protein
MRPVKKRFCVLLVCFLIVSCGRNNFSEKYLQEYLNSHAIFDDRSIFSNPYYNLTKEELIMAGRWLSYEYKDNLHAGSYYFYPNHFFMVGFGFGFRDDNTKRLLTAMGIWEIKNDAVYARIYLLEIVTTMPNGDKVETYEAVSPYEVSLIKMKDVALAGYTRKNFDKFKLPEDITEQIIEPPYSAKIHQIRQTGDIYYIDYELHYGLFEWLPEMEKNNHTGLDMINDIELIKKYTTDLYWVYKIDP